VIIKSDYNINTMLRILKKLALPNVVSFNLSDNEPILQAYMAGLPANTGRKMEEIKKTKRLNRANKYLSKQFRRLETLSNSNAKAFDYLSLKLMRNSVTYRMYSINRVFPQWISARLDKIKKIERSVKKLSKDLSTDIDYKRVWIDKKPGDYGRPLGVPTMTWRIYLGMITNIAEIYALGNKLYSDCQHGGRPERGVMTCLKAVAEQLNSKENIYEFDLKGFFDHISIQSIVSLFKGVFLGDMFNKLLRVAPKAYQLPPLSKDKAIEIQNRLLEIRESVIDDFTELMEPDPGEDDPADLVFAILQDEGDSPETVMIKMMDEINDYINSEISLEAIYAAHMRGVENIELVDILDQEVFTESHRALGRDMWKDLHLKDQGVPQGTNFGPFLASLVIGRGLQRIPNSLIYLDDGLCFFNTEAELSNIKEELSRIVKDISVEIAPEKSGVITKKDLLTKGIKFLGTRMKGSRNFFTIASETRAGVKRELPELSTEKMLDILESMFEAGMITPSKYKFAKWSLLKAKFNDRFVSPVLDASIKGNFFGYLLSWLYNPEMDMNTAKRKISEGTKLAKARMTSSKGSISRGIFDHDIWEYEGPGGTVEIVRPTIYNASTLCMDLYLETYEYGYVSLREFGLVNNGKDKPLFSLAYKPISIRKERIESKTPYGIIDRVYNLGK
jgi:hypothetical protein